MCITKQKQTIQKEQKKINKLKSTEDIPVRNN